MDVNPESHKSHRELLAAFSIHRPLVNSSWVACTSCIMDATCVYNITYIYIYIYDHRCTYIRSMMDHMHIHILHHIHMTHHIHRNTIYIYICICAHTEMTNVACMIYVYMSTVMYDSSHSTSVYVLGEPTSTRRACARRVAVGTLHARRYQLQLHVDGHVLLHHGQLATKQGHQGVLRMQNE